MRQIYFLFDAKIKQMLIGVIVLCGEILLATFFVIKPCNQFNNQTQKGK